MRRTWLAPMLLAAINAIGLLAALLGDGVWDALSWLALAVPVAICPWYSLRSTKQR